MNDKIIVHWGEEKIPTTQRFTMITVGPFIFETTIKSGETVEGAFKRANAVVRKMAEAERKRKIASYQEMLVECGFDVEE